MYIYRRPLVKRNERFIQIQLKERIKQSLAVRWKRGVCKPPAKIQILLLPCCSLSNTA